MILWPDLRVRRSSWKGLALRLSCQDP